MKSETIDTIIDVLETDKARLIKEREWWGETSHGYKQCSREIDELDAALADLREAETGAWEPVPDGKNCAESPDGSDEWCIKVTDDGDSIWQYSSSDGEWTEIGSLSFWGYRLCRRTATPQPAQRDAQDAAG